MKEQSKFYSNMKIDINKIASSYQSLTLDNSEQVNKGYFNDTYGYRGIPVVFKKAFDPEKKNPSSDNIEDILSVFNCWLSQEDSDEKLGIISEKKETFSDLHSEKYYKGKWSSLLSGKKLWLVYPSTFNSEINNNRSQYQFNNLENIIEKIDENLIKPFYAIQEPGDLIFIPGNNHHMYINLEETAVLQKDFINEINYDNVRIAFKQLKIEDAKHLEKTIKKNFEKLRQSSNPTF